MQAFGSTGKLGAYNLVNESQEYASSDRGSDESVIDNLNDSLKKLQNSTDQMNNIYPTAQVPESSLPPGKSVKPVKRPVQKKLQEKRRKQNKTPTTSTPVSKNVDFSQRTATEHEIINKFANYMEFILRSLPTKESFLLQKKILTILINAYLTHIDPNYCSPAHSETE